MAGLPGHYTNVWRCGGLSMVLLQLKVPLGLFLKRKEGWWLPDSVFAVIRNGDSQNFIILSIL